MPSIGVSLADNIALHEPDLSKAFLERVRPHDTFLNVGAHIGDYTREVRKRSDGYIASIEPNPLCSRELLIDPPAAPWTLVAAMAMDRISIQAPLTIPIGDWGEGLSYGCGGASIVPFAYSAGNARVVVPAIALDDLLKAWPKGFDLLKIDIEGSELEAIRGASRVLSLVRVVALEIHTCFLLPRVNGNKKAVENACYEMAARLLAAGLEIKEQWNQGVDDKTYELWERK